MNLEKKTINIKEKTCFIYMQDHPDYILIQPVDDHDLDVLDTEIAEISKGQDAAFALIAFKITDWNQELSPWEAPPVFGQEGFGSGAGDTLRFVVEDLIPSIRQQYGLDDSIPVILGGYSLAGFFALWSSYQEPCFAAVMAASPSVWFNGWIDYAKENTPKSGSIYLSLGDKEEKTRNQTMARVGDAIREQADILAMQHVNCNLEWNTGNHFMDADLRCAKGFIWCMNTLTR